MTNEEKKLEEVSSERDSAVPNDGLDRDGFELAVRPLMKWLEKNCHPHVYVLVDSQDAVLTEGVLAVRPDFKDRTRPARF